VTIALEAQRERKSRAVDLSRPTLIAFAALLCILILLPIAWLTYYSVTDKTGAFTLGNFT
jgi:iron(III) transport system permease protein